MLSLLTKQTKTTGQENVQNLLFGTQAPEWNLTIPSEPDSTYSVSNPDDLSVANFCSRPILIKHVKWTPGETMHEEFDPWSLFFENKRVINRISNFRALRCKLHVRFLVSGTPFHFGRAMVSYTPLKTRDNYYSDRITGSVGSEPVWQDAVLTSQKPRIFLDPTTSEGGSMVLPFLWPNNALDIISSEWRLMGSLVLRSLNTLHHAMGGSSDVDISVFAWAEDVHLSFPTSVPPMTLVPQSGDEFGDGVVSRPAAAVAAAAGKLTAIPSIAPYAKATQIAAGAVASAAKHLGMSRPAVIDPPCIVRPRFSSNLANTSVPDTVQSLAYDVKQELTIDTRTIGLAGVDEMSINHIASVESYIGSFQMSELTDTDTLLWNMYVDPFVFHQRTNPLTGNMEMFMPATAYVSLPFRTWTGTLRYRFQIASAAAHRGKIRIVYDPLYCHNTYNAFPEEQNLAHTTIVDISQERDFTIEVGWGQVKSIVSHLDYGDGWIASDTRLPLPPSAGGTGNGVLAVYVQNELTSPSPLVPDPISFNVFLSAGPDFRVFEPDGSFLETLSFYPPKPLAAQSGEGSTPTAAEIAAQLSPCDSSTKLDMVFYGDPIMSIRQLLRRYSYLQYTPSDSGVTSAYSLKTTYYPALPPPRGYVSTGAQYSNKYNYTNMTHYSYFVAAYAAWRGSSRYKIFYLAQPGSAHKMYFAVAKRRPYAYATNWREATPVQSPYGSVGFTSPLSCSKQMMEFFGGLSEGAIMQPLGPDQVLEVEIPFYDNLRFMSPRIRNVISSDSPGMLVKTLDAENQQSAGAHAFIAAGEDLLLGMYLGPPIMYNEALPAT